MASTATTAATMQQSPARLLLHQQQKLPQQQQSPAKLASSSANDDPDKLLNEWLGELENLIGVSRHFVFFLLPSGGIPIFLMSLGVASHFRLQSYYIRDMMVTESI